MHSPRRSGLTVSLALCAVLGCATPGPPKPPSLNLPELTRDLTATRIGNTVELRFTVPSRSTDKLPLRGPNLTARFCRSVDALPCQTLPSTVVPLDAKASRHPSFTWIDKLPADLTDGNPRLLRYNVELLNASGRSAGRSEPAFTAAGSVPSAVTALSAQGSRLGILLRWEAAHTSGEIVLQRKDLAKAGEVQLTAPAGSNSVSLLDTSAKLGTAYRYTATRSLTVKIGDRAINLRSSPSASVDVTLKAIYPPLAPTGLTAAAFTEAKDSVFAIDLIWQPVDESGAIAALAGYNVYRATGDTSPTRLNASPVALPAFHDISAIVGVQYRYSVTAVDVVGNESLATFVVVRP